MNGQELKYWVGISGFKGLGIKRLKLLKKYFGSVKNIWQAGKPAWIRVGIKPEMASGWQQRQENHDLDAEMKELARRLIKVVTIEDIRYPKILKEIDSPPFLIYVKGRVEMLNQPCLAMVGTRKPTEYGRKAAKDLVKQLAGKLVIVSGLARGIDSLVHWQCLVEEVKTAAVLGHGLEQIYPKENVRLAQEIVDQGGCLITEFPLNYPMDKVNFPQRNRIIAGLTLGTLVIEGGQRSGTKITANMAADYGREVFCVPGPINSELSMGPAELIQNGAKLVTKAEDILEELNLN